MARRLVAVGLVLGLPWLLGCLWDDDTLSMEAKGIPEIVRVVTGRFERNPPLYYEMRLDRVTKVIESNPNDLGAYDNAGVACDRLGRGDEAIAWMERKANRLDAQADLRGTSDAEWKEHRYRYLANVGTFWIHRWLRAGADRERLDEVRTARDFIAQAIELNPDAHFGRERYQLAALDWILHPPEGKSGRLLSTLPVFFDPGEDTARAEEVVRGLSGLIVLGNAWESVDVFNTLALALERAGDRTSVAELARLRCGELIDEGRRSLWPGAASEPQTLKNEATSASIDVGMNMIRDGEKVKAMYRSLREEAETWARERTVYMLARLEAGRHPDLDREFWDEYRERPAPDTLWKEPGMLARAGAALSRPAEGGIAVVTGVLALIVLGLGRMWFWRRRQKQARLEEV